MTGAVLSFAEALKPFVAEGSGVQYFTIRPAPFAGVPVQKRTIDGPQASLDFVVAGPEWWLAENPIEIVHEWRRCLKDGGRLAALLETTTTPLVAVMRLLANECGLDMAKPLPVEGDVFLLSGRRSIGRSIGRHFAGIRAEIGRDDRPENWRSELWFDLAAVLLQAGEGRKAAEFFSLVIAEDCECLEARVGLALALALIADWDEAAAILQEVLKTDPEHGLAAEWLRRCRAQAGIESNDKTVLTPALPKQKGGGHK